MLERSTGKLVCCVLRRVGRRIREYGLLIRPHAAIKLLTSKGFSEDQAEAIVFIEEEKADKLVTNSDLKIAMQELKIDLIKWVTPFFLTTILLIVGLWFK